ncbi:ABC transporter ATP-binding protein [Tumebacillus lipolyticus]|uniref:ABC transporter ATP-binding protein n=1 Tax=Tumebacillus lipolyticus TaxID=1280370 RepID=A0ABW4ZST1_9BACL
MVAISLEQISHKYLTDSGETTALTDISFTIEQGEFVGLVGPSGCGKSTILSLIAGLLFPSAGKVTLFGEAVVRPTHQLGYMFQQDYLLPWRTIEQNVLLGLEITGRLSQAKRERALRLLDEMGLLGTADRYPHQLSGGMRQRAALVRTLASEPQVVLLDEPFSALDYQIKLQLEALIAQTLSSHRLTGLLVTHDLGEAIAMCDRIIVMAGRPGRILRILRVPDTIRALSPLEARESAEFHGLFRQVWRDFQDEA